MKQLGDKLLANSFRILFHFCFTLTHLCKLKRKKIIMLPSHEDDSYKNTLSSIELIKQVKILVPIFRLHSLSNQFCRFLGTSFYVHVLTTKLLLLIQCPPSILTVFRFITSTLILSFCKAVILINLLTVFEKFDFEC